MKARALVVASVLLLAGCGGGGGTTPQIAPTTAPTSSPAGSYKSTATVTLSIPLPTKPGSDKRNPQYVSPNSAKVVVTVNTVDNATPPTWVTPNPDTIVLTTTGGTPNCTVNTVSGVETCTVMVPAPPGLVNYTFQVEDVNNNVLSTLTTPQQIAAGTTTTFTITLLGVASTVVISPATLNAGTPTAVPCGVIVKDASGAPITGTANYFNPVTLTDSDTSGASTMDVNGGTASTSVTLNSPTDIVTCHYSGLAALPFTITASGTGISGTQTFTPVLNPIVLIGGANLQIDTGNAADPNYNQQTVFFGATGGSAIVNASEVGWSGSPFNKTFTATPDPTTCAGPVATVTAAGAAGGGENFTVAGLSTGVCKVTVTDGVNQSKIFWISVSAANITLQ